MAIIAFLVLGSMVLILTVIQWINGAVWMGGTHRFFRMIYRGEQPFWFWVYIITYIIVSVLLFACGVLLFFGIRI